MQFGEDGAFPLVPQNRLKSQANPAEPQSTFQAFRKTEIALPVRRYGASLRQSLYQVLWGGTARATSGAALTRSLESAPSEGRRTPVACQNDPRPDRVGVDLGYANG